MFGENVNRLVVYQRISQMEYPSVVWSKEGDQGDQWLRGEVPFTVGAKFQVIVEGAAGPGARGDNIALDDFSFSPACTLDPSNSLPITVVPTSHPNCSEGELACNDGTCIPYDKFCDFRYDCNDGSDEWQCPPVCTYEDNTLCYWTQVQSDDFDWKIRDGSEPDSFKGPVYDHSYINPPGKYLYVDGIDSRTDQRGLIASPLYRLAGTSCKFHVYYYMFGIEFGDLEVYLKWGAKQRLLAKVSDDFPDYNKWILQEVEIPHCLENFQVIIDAEDRMPIPSEGGFAIDDLRFDDCAYNLPSTGQCPSDFRQCESGHCFAYSVMCDYQLDCCDGTDEEECTDYNRCDFETGFCDWEQLTTDEFDWTRNKGSTGTGGTGPSEDHTTESPNGYYIYIETSNPRNNGDRARLGSYLIDYSGILNVCAMRFYYHMRGDETRSLNIYTRTMINGDLTLQWTLTGEQDSWWHRAEVDLDIRDPFQVIIEGVAGDGNEGDIALDDISFTPDCERYNRELPILTTQVPIKLTTLEDVCQNPNKFQCRDNTCIDKEMKCDFKYQCPDSSDELGCPIICNLETDMCGWQESNSAVDNFDWHRANGQDTSATPTVAPRTDHSTGSSTGYYLYIAPSGQASVDQVAQMASSIYSSAAAYCELNLWYIMSGRNVGGIMLLLVDTTDGSETLLWHNSVDSGESWQSLTIGIGRRRNPFKLKVRKERNLDYQGMIALDDITFTDCALPDPSQSCDPGKFRCSNDVCIPANQVCDMSDDCGDNSDERTCRNQGFNQCDFETSICDWSQATATDDFDWTRFNGATPSVDTGPSRDHTTGTSDGYYLYIDTSTPSNYNKVAELLSINYVDNGGYECTFTFYYHMYGTSVRNLKAYARQYKDSNYGDQMLFSKSGGQSDAWMKADVSVNIQIGKPFQIVIEASAGDTSKGDIAIDDVSVGPGCTTYSGSLPDPPGTIIPPTTTPGPGACTPQEFYCEANQKCIPETALCDFKNDCDDGTDEVGCVSPSCDFEIGLCNWQVTSGSGFEWTRVQGVTAGGQDYRPSVDHTSDSAQGWYVFAQTDPGTFKTSTTLKTPVISATADNCKLSFWYHISGSAVGSLGVYTTAGSATDAVWYVSGVQGDAWNEAEVLLGRGMNYAVSLTARRGSTYAGDISIDDVKFLGCSPPAITGVPCNGGQFQCTDTYCIDASRVCDFSNDCYDGSDEATCDESMRCDFEVDLCSWHQDYDDTFDWSLRNDATGSANKGPLNDHSINSFNGYYIYLDSAWPRQFGDVARISSMAVRAGNDLCAIRFWYHMYGADVGTLTVYQRTSYIPTLGGMYKLQEISENSNYWHMMDVKLPNTGTDFQVVFEGSRGTSTLGDIAIDDVSFSSDCAMGSNIPGSPETDPTTPYCAHGEYACREDNTCYPPEYRCNFARTCPDETDEIECGHSCYYEDNSQCGWFNSYSDGLEWRYGNAGSGNGPPTDHSTGSALGNYMYIASTTDSNAGFAYLSTLAHRYSSQNCNMFFYYYMDGNSDSYLTVYIKSSDSRLKKLYETPRSQQDSWQLSDTINIGEHTNFAVIIQAKRSSGGNERYIAIDDVNFANQCGYGADKPINCGPDDFHCKDEGKTCVKNDLVCNLNDDCPDGSDEASCTSQTGDCTFDQSQAIASCSWQQLSDDDFDWSVGTSTPTPGTGPTGDRTGTGSFLFIEATSQQQGSLARVATPSLPGSSGKCLVRFWYHMNGASMGGLKVYVKDTVTSRMNLMWSTGGNQDDYWIYASVELISDNDYQVVFEGSVGSGELSDAAIDDVTFSDGCYNPGAPRPTDPPGPRCNFTDAMFCPGDRVCIPGTWMCDGVLDCPLDYYDEPGLDMCQNLTLPTKQPQTSDDGVIIAIIVIACILVLILLLLVTYLYAKKRQQQKRFGEIARDHAGGMDNPVYGTETYGDTPLHDFTMSDVDTSMFGDSAGASKEKPRKTSITNPAFDIDPTLPIDNDTKPIVKDDSLA